jgi:hypothetical protein
MYSKAIGPQIGNPAQMFLCVPTCHLERPTLTVCTTDCTTEPPPLLFQSSDGVEQIGEGRAPLQNLVATRVHRATY